MQHWGSKERSSRASMRGCLRSHVCCACVWQVNELQAQVKQLQEALTDAERRVLEGEMIRRKLHNVIQVCVPKEWLVQVGCCRCSSKLLLPCLLLECS